MARPESKINEKEVKADSNGTRLEQLCEIIVKQETHKTCANVIYGTWKFMDINKQKILEHKKPWQHQHFKYTRTFIFTSVYFLQTQKRFSIINLGILCHIIMFFLQNFGHKRVTLLLLIYIDMYTIWPKYSHAHCVNFNRIL